MKAVWKYDLTLSREIGAGHRTLEVPRGAEFIFVGLEPSEPTPRNLRVWAIVETEAPLETRTIRIAETGEDLVGSLKYIGSVVATPLAWHVFERIA